MLDLSELGEDESAAAVAVMRRSAAQGVRRQRGQTNLPTSVDLNLWTVRPLAHIVPEGEEKYFNPSW